MKNKKGFTLVELLAVIVILAIIVVIAVPIILNVIEDSKKGSAKAGALGYLDAVEKQMVVEFTKDTDFDISGELETGNEFLNKINVKGTKPTYVLLTLDKKKVVKAEICINEYGFTIDSKGKAVDNKNICSNTRVTEINVTNEEIINDSLTLNNSSFSLALSLITNNGEEYDGVITYESSNPEIVSVSSDGTITPIAEGETTITIKVGEVTKVITIKVVMPICEASTSLTNSGLGYLVTQSHPFKKGTEYKCKPDGVTTYTFYVLEDNSSTTGEVTLLMDRNLVASSAWSNPETNTPTTANAALANATSSWTKIDVGKILMPTYGQMYNIYNQATFYSSDYASRWTCSNGTSYWTSTHHGYSGGHFAKYVVCNSSYTSGASQSRAMLTDKGIRPTITISKDKFSY